MSSLWLRTHLGRVDQLQQRWVSAWLLALMIGAVTIDGSP